MSSAPAEAGTLRERLRGGETLRLVSFVLHGRSFACLVDVVEEVVDEPRIHPLPDPPAGLAGMLALRGELLPVLDIAPAVGLGPTAEPGAVVVLSVGGRRFGLVADAPGELVEVAAADVQQTHGEREGGGGLHVGYARLGRDLVMLVDPAGIVAGTPSQTPQESP